MISCPRVLVVADNDDTRIALCGQLARAAYTVYGVCDGIEALMELVERPWDVVLTDCRMPRLNGLDLLRIITLCWPDTSVVMVSGEPSDTARLALKHGAFAWIGKPFDLAHLLQKVRAAVLHAFELRAQKEHGRSKQEGQ